MPRTLRFFQTVIELARADLGLLRRHRLLRLAVLGVGLVPAVYALIYLSSVWDPNGRTSALPAALVNLDTGLRYRGQEANVGRELSQQLLAQGTFGWQSLRDTDTARRAVARGDVAFAVIIPPDFSAQALPGAEPGAGQLRVILSEGNNYSAAGFARRFAQELGHRVNQTLNEQRWELVLTRADGSRRDLERLKAAVAELRGGARTLSEGTGRFVSAGSQLASGLRQTASALRTMESRLPAEQDLSALRGGAHQLGTGQRELGNGLARLHEGAGRLEAGARKLQEEGSGIPFFGGKVASAAGELATGADQLGDGLQQARGASEQLALGASQLEGGVTRLTEGLGQLGGGLRTLAGRLPPDAQLDRFEAGGRDLAGGATRLRDGLRLLDSAVPAGLDRLEGSARGLADSVEPVLENLAPVPNNGSAFAPNMVAVALWIGAVMAAYLFNLNLLPASQYPAPRLAQVMGKFLVPCAVTLLQSGLVFVTLVFLLGVQTPYVVDLLLTMAVASWVFLAMLFALQRVFGEASKLLAVLLLTLQLAAGGGVLPVELSGGLFQTVHAWLPFTWVVKAFRASLFGAYEHAWAQAWGTVLLAGAVALAIGTVVGRWKVVADEAYRPGLEL